MWTRRLSHLWLVEEQFLVEMVEGLNRTESNKEKKSETGSYNKQLTLTGTHYTASHTKAYFTFLMCMYTHTHTPSALFAGGNVFLLVKWQKYSPRNEETISDWIVVHWYRTLNLKHSLVSVNPLSQIYLMDSLRLFSINDAVWHVSLLQSIIYYNTFKLVLKMLSRK